MTDPADHLRAFLESIGLDAADDEELARTPERVSELMQQLFSAVDAPAPEMSLFDAEGQTEPVVLLGLPFYSMCVHHLVPFFGTIDLAYVPDARMAGFGSFCRVLDHVAQRPQIQERLVGQMAEIIEEQLQPAGLLIRCRARQMCVELRNTDKRGTIFVSSAASGSLEQGPTRAELLRQFSHAECRI